jgi:hypothetical protein
VQVAKRHPQKPIRLKHSWSEDSSDILTIR